MKEEQIVFVDLKAQRDRLRDRLDKALARVIDHCDFIMGEEVEDFENRLAGYTGAKNVITCANGTDALQLVMMAEGIGPGDAVFVPAFTFVATAEVVVVAGATPVFVDVYEDTFNMAPASLEEAVNTAKKLGLEPRMVIPVDLFGQPADYQVITAVAEQYNLIVVADAAQSLGGKLNKQRVGTLATWTTTSFFPSKPLGCFGDGGAIMTDDRDNAEIIRSLKNHGKGKDRYDNVRIGMNSRLDTLQAAVLIEKLSIFDEELQERDRIARRYTEMLSDIVETPVLMEGVFSSWAQYTIKVDDRDGVREQLKSAGIPMAVYYPIPLNRQKAYQKYPVTPNGVPVAEIISEKVISLPMHPYLDESTQDRIIDAVRTAIN